MPQTPTFVAGYEFESGGIAANSQGTATGSLTLPTFTPAVGETLVLWLSTGTTTLTPNTGPANTTGIVWTLQIARVVTDTTPLYCWTAQVTQSVATTITVPYRFTLASSTQKTAAHLTVERYSGVALPATPNVFAPTTAITTTSATAGAQATFTQQTPGSMVSWIGADWNGRNTGTPVYVAGNTQTQIYLASTAGWLGSWTARQGPNATAGSKTVGMSSWSTGAGSRKMMFGVIELPPAPDPEQASFSAVSDDFTGPLARGAGELWSGTYDPDPNPDTVTVSGRARITAAAGPNYANFETAEAYSMAVAGSALRYRGVVPAPMSPGSAGSVQTALLVLSSTVPAGTRLAITHRADLGTLRFTSEGTGTDNPYGDSSGVEVPYDPVAHWGWGIREDNGNVVFETSADGITWQTQRTITRPAWLTTTAPQRATCEAWRESGDTTYAEVGSVNVTPPAVPTTMPTGTDALQTRTLDELADWKAWLGTTRGLLGEFGWVTLYGDTTGAPEWNALGEKYLTAAEVHGLDTTAWASGREWGDGYPTSFHVGTTVDAPLTIATSGAPVLAAHPTRGGRFHGVNLSGWEQGISIDGGGTVRSGAGYVHTLADFQFLAANGIDFVRLPMAWERLQPTLGAALDTTALTALDGMLAAARQTGIRVLLDLHNYGRYTLADGATVYTLGGQLTTAHLTDLWTRLSTWVKADRDRSATVVAYDVMNEPHDMPTGAGGWQSASQAALDAIRAAGDTRLVVIQGYAWGSLTNWRQHHPAGWITDTTGNFAYQAHHYWDTQSALGNRSGTYQQSPTGPILTYEIELASAQSTAWTRTLADTTAAADSPSRSMTNHRLAGDGLTFTDTVGVVVAFAASTTDTASASDATSSTTAHVRNLTDSLDTDDSLVSTGSSSVEQVDEVVIVDDLIVTVDHGRVLDDAVNVDDQMTFVYGTIVQYLEPVATNERLDIEAEYTRGLADASSVGESLDRAAVLERHVDDASTSSDVVRAVRTTHAPAEDAVGIDDAITATVARGGKAVDAVALDDDAVGVSTIKRRVVDTARVDEAIDVVTTGRVTQAADPTAEVDTAFEPGVSSASRPVPVAVETSAAFSGRADAQANVPRAAAETDFAYPPTVIGSYPTAQAADVELAFSPVVLVDDGAFAEAIDSPDRVPVFTLKADWNRNGLYDHPLSDLTTLVEEVTVDRSLTGTLPAEVGLVEGYSSAALSVRLAGHWNGDPEATFDPADIFAPYRPDSPLYGAPVLRTPLILETGFVTEKGPRLDRRFTGTISSISPSSADRTVEVAGLDPATQLRATVTIAGSAMYATVLSKYGPDSYRSRMNSQWLIDQALRANGIYASPPPRPDALLSVTGHGSMIPEIGWGGAPQEYYSTYRGEMWQPGPFGPLATRASPFGRWWLTSQITAASGSGIGMSMWLAMAPSNGSRTQLLSIDLTSDYSFYLTLGIDTDGRPYVGAKPSGSEVRTKPSGYNPPSASTWQYVGVHVAFGSTSMTATWRINGVSYTSSASISSRNSNWKPGPYIYYTWYRAFTNFQLWTSPTAPGTNGWQGSDPNWVPQADLDPGVNELTGIPQLQAVDAWELIKAVTDAEGSTFQFTEGGRPQFITSAGDVLYGRTREVHERISADRNLSDLVSTTDESTIRNIINIKTKTQLVSDWQDYFEATTVDQFDTPPGTSVFDIPIEANVYDVPESRDAYGVRTTLPAATPNASFLFTLAEEDWRDAANLSPVKDRIRLNLVYANNPVEITASSDVPAIYIRVSRVSPQLMRIYITNYSSGTVRFATPTTTSTDGAVNEGSPALVIPARVVEQGVEQVETYTDNASVVTYGPSPYDVGGGDETWRQTPDGLRGLATEVLATTANPVPVLDAVDVPHDPRRRLGQRIVLADPNGLGEVAATIVGLSSAYSSSGASDKITVRPIAPPGLGVLDDDTHGRLDVSLVLGP